jgi:hypothetical protein
MPAADNYDDGSMDLFLFVYRRYALFALCFLGSITLIAAQSAMQPEDHELQRRAPGAGFRSCARGLPSPNLHLPGHVSAPMGSLTLYADFDRAGPDRVPLYLVNRTAEPVAIPVQDGDLGAKLEFLDETHAWVRAQNHQYSWCGNSYYHFWLPPGHHVILDGYLPREGTPATVRYRTVLHVPLTSNPGPGRYHVEDRLAASRDKVAVQSVPPGFKRFLLFDPDSGFQSPTPDQFAAVLQLLSRYQENGYCRIAAERFVATLPRESPASALIQTTLGTRWPSAPDRAGLLQVCLEAVDPMEPRSGLAVDQHPEVAWGLIADQLLIMHGKEVTSREEELMRRAYALLPGSVRSGVPGAVAAASELLRLPAFAQESVTSDLLLAWVKDGPSPLLEPSVALLRDRPEGRELVDLAGKLTKGDQLRVLGELAAGLATAAGTNADVDTFESAAEREFWIHCATAYPLETSSILTGRLPRERLALFPDVILPPLRRFLEEEVERASGVAPGPQAPSRPSEVAKVLSLVAAWGQRSDAPLFVRLLAHPGFETGSVFSEKQSWEIRRYPVRAAALRALIGLGVPLSSPVVTEERLPAPGPEVR